MNWIKKNKYKKKQNKPDPFWNELCINSYNADNVFKKLFLKNALGIKMQ